MTHELKILPEYFKDVRSGLKNFEIRQNDRDFKVGDTLVLQEYFAGEGYTGRKVIKKIKYVFEGDGSFGLSKEYCVLGLEE